MGLGLLHCQLVGLPPRPVTCGVRKEDTTGEPQQPKQSQGAASVWYIWGSPLSPVLLELGLNGLDCCKEKEITIYGLMIQPSVQPRPFALKL